MTSARARDVVLALIGFGAWLVYVLACGPLGPSFSPDDAKILFPSIDPVTGDPVLTMYDRQTRVVRPVVVISGADENVIRPLWTEDGTTAVTVWYEKTGNDPRLHVLTAPLDRQHAARFLSVPFAADTYDSLFFPPPIIGERLFVAGRSGLLRLDLASGAAKTNDALGENLGLFEQDHRLYYVKDLNGETRPDGNTREVGRVNGEALTCEALFQFSSETEGDLRSVAVSPTDEHIALLMEQGGVFHVSVFDDGHRLGSIPIPPTAEGLSLGKLEWSRDGSVWFVPYSRPLTGGAHECGVLEMSTDGSRAQRTPLFGCDSGRTEALFQIGLSHDGNTLAVASTGLTESIALYLVDVSTVERGVTRIPVSAATETAASNHRQ